jgi:hypothetical protein
MNIWLTAIYVLLIIQCYAQTPFTVTLESPGIDNQVSPLVVNGQAYGANGVIQQTFDALSKGTNTKVSLGSVGAYSQINVVKADVFGGAGGTGNYVSIRTSPVTITFTAPQRYFGMWWSAGDPNNVLQFYSGNTLVQTFTTKDVLTFINNLPASQRSLYFGNPNTHFQGGNSGEPYAFLNFFADPSNETVTFNTIELYQASSGGAFESDNHTIAAGYTSITGMEIDPEPIAPIPGDTVDVGSGGVIESTVPAIIGNDSALDVNNGGQVMESAPIMVESGGRLVDSGEVMDSAPVLVESGGELMGSGIVETPMLVNDGTLNSTGSGMTIDGTLMDMPGSETVVASNGSEIKVNGKADLGGELILDIDPKVGTSKIVLNASGGVSGEFNKVVDPLNTKNLTDVTIYAKNGVDEVFLPPGEGEISLKTSMSVDAKNLVISSLDPTAEELTSLYQIGFSAADMQRFNLGDRMFQIQQSVVPPQPVTELAPPTTKENEGKGVEGKAPPPAPPPSPINRWGGWASGWGDFANVDSSSAAQGYRLQSAVYPPELITSSYPITSPLACSEVIHVRGSTSPHREAPPPTPDAAGSTQPTLTGGGGWTQPVGQEVLTTQPADKA